MKRSLEITLHSLHPLSTFSSSLLVGGRGLTLITGLTVFEKTIIKKKEEEGETHKFSERALTIKKWHEISVRSSIQIPIYHHKITTSCVLNSYWSRRFKPLPSKEQLVAISSSHEIADHDLRSFQATSSPRRTLEDIVYRVPIRAKGCTNTTASFEKLTYGEYCSPTSFTSGRLKRATHARKISRSNIYIYDLRSLHFPRFKSLDSTISFVQLDSLVYSCCSLLPNSSIYRESRYSTIIFEYIDNIR